MEMREPIIRYKSSEIRRAGQLWGNTTTASRSHLCQIDTRINCIVQSREHYHK